MRSPFSHQFSLLLERRHTSNRELHVDEMNRAADRTGNNWRSCLAIVESLMSSRVEGWDELGENEKVLRVLDRACSDETVTRAVEGLWKKRFVADAPIPH